MQNVKEIKALNAENSTLESLVRVTAILLFSLAMIMVLQIQLHAYVKAAIFLMCLSWAVYAVWQTFITAGNRYERLVTGGAGGIGGNDQGVYYGGRFATHGTIVYEWPEDILPGEEIEERTPVTVH